MDIWEDSLAFGAEEPFFKGHFPGHPVTPGVILIGKAVEAAERMIGRRIVLKSIRKVKFSHPVLPGETVDIRLERRGEGEITYRFSKAGALCASGTLCLSE